MKLLDKEYILNDILHIIFMTFLVVSFYTANYIYMIGPIIWFSCKFYEFIVHYDDYTTLIRKEGKNPMIITGYKYGANKEIAIASLRKHMHLNETMAKELVDSVYSGVPTKIKDDFVLREELEANRFTVAK